MDMVGVCTTMYGYGGHVWICMGYGGCMHYLSSTDGRHVLPANLKLLNLEENKLSDWSQVLKLTYLSQ